jgi:hypothetical protein
VPTYFGDNWRFRIEGFSGMSKLVPESSYQMEIVSRPQPEHIESISDQYFGRERPKRRGEIENTTGIRRV